MGALIAVPAVSAADPVARRVAARFSMTDPNAQEEEPADTQLTSWIRRVFRKVGERFGY